MKGTRPLSTDEILNVSEQFDGTFEVRNRSLFMLGVSVGGRISYTSYVKPRRRWSHTFITQTKKIIKGR